jgi:hypothetical protein
VIKHRVRFIIVFALSALAVGMWVDIADRGRTDLLRDVLSTGIMLVFGAIAGDTALTLIERVRGQARPLIVIGVCVLGVLVGHMLLPFMAMLVQVPRVGLGFLPTIVEAMAFVLRQAIGPSLVVGTLLGLVIITTTSTR